MRRSKGNLHESFVTVAELCQRYHVQHPVEKSTGTMDRYKFKILLPILGNVPAEVRSSKDLSNYVQTRLKNGKKRSIISRELRLLKAVFSWAEQQEPSLIMHNAVSRFKLPRISDKEIPVPPSVEEIQSLLRVAEPHLVRAIMIFWYTGVRPGKELCAIRWSDVDLAGNTMRVTSARKGGPVTRFVPLSDDLVRRMSRWLQEDLKRKEDVSDLAITHFRLKPVLSLKRSWNTAKERAGIHRKLRLYDLRHAMISNALRRGADLKAVSEVVGHSRPDTTLREYQHIVKEQHREVVNVIPGLDEDEDLEGVGA